jgi:hypothetical protein
MVNESNLIIKSVTLFFFLLDGFIDQVDEVTAGHVAGTCWVVVRRDHLLAIGTDRRLVVGRLHLVDASR